MLAHEDPPDLAPDPRSRAHDLSRLARLVVTGDDVSRFGPRLYGLFDDQDTDEYQWIVDHFRALGREQAVWTPEALEEFARITEQIPHVGRGSPSGERTSDTPGAVPPE